MSPLIVLVLGACSGGGGGGSSGSAATPASVAGTWSGAGAKAAGSQLTSCSGDMTGLDGNSWSPVLGAYDGCTIEPMQVTQSGDTFTIAATRYHCSIGITGTLSGRGTVSGTSLQGEIDDVAEGFSDKLVRFVSGSVAGNQVTLAETRLEMHDPSDGPVTGACEFAPSLTVTGTIVPPDQAPASVCGGAVASRPAVCQLSIGNSIAAPADNPMLVPGEISPLRFGFSDAEGDVVAMCGSVERLGDAGQVIATTVLGCSAWTPRLGLVNEFGAEEVLVPANLQSGDYRFVVAIKDAAGNESEPVTTPFTVITF